MSQFGTCRYCGRRIIWIKTKAGRNMPVDHEMVSYRAAREGEVANEKLVTPDGDVVTVVETTGDEAEGFGYKSHFASCKRKKRKSDRR